MTPEQLKDYLINKGWVQENEYFRKGKLGIHIHLNVVYCQQLILAPYTGKPHWIDLMQGNLSVLSISEKGKLKGLVV